MRCSMHVFLKTVHCDVFCVNVFEANRLTECFSLLW